MKSFKALMVACSLGGLALLGACGGGGGSAGKSVFDTAETDSTVGTSDASITVTLSSTTVKPTAPVTVFALVENSAGTAQANKVVTFSTTDGTGTIAPSTALTNAAGIATATLSGTATSGADTVTASADVDGEAVVGSAGFQFAL